MYQPELNKNSFFSKTSAEAIKEKIINLIENILKRPITEDFSAEIADKIFDFICKYSSVDGELDIHKIEYEHSKEQDVELLNIGAKP